MGKRYKLVNDRIRHERELREASQQSIEHEREFRAVADAHERELRLQAEAAIEKARSTQFSEYERRLEGMNEFREQLQRQAATFLTIDRFEREHAALQDKMETNLGALAARFEQQYGQLGQQLGEEQNVTVAQNARSEVIDSLNTNRRWLIGLAVAIFTTLALTAAHISGVVK